MNVTREMRTGGYLASFVVNANVVRRPRKTRTTCQDNDASTDLRSEIEVAVRAVRSACRVCFKVQEDVVECATEKCDATPVTSADLAIQAIVSLELERCFPEVRSVIPSRQKAIGAMYSDRPKTLQDGLIGEEDSSPLHENEHLAARVTGLVSSSEADNRVGSPLKPEDVIHAVDRCTDGGTFERFWVLDPIDGTRGFLAKSGYVVGLALIVQDVCVLSVMGCPAIGSILASVKGRGSILVSLDEPNEEVSSRFDTNPFRKGAKSLTSWTFSGPSIPVMPLLLGPNNPPDRLCCGSLIKYFKVALGHVSAFVQFGIPVEGVSRLQEIKSWDHVAGWLAITETGGSLTDGRGNTLKLDGKDPSRVFILDGLIASSDPSYHDEVREQVLESIIKFSTS
ncbi:hypothetical protein NDN08_008225 [Rhodosorus marinus]|uniref:3'(2'),5'-bisphosphate nucleotidase n=1 Tax=Rhodosorus marinus TaxID=101924 RepID=A0AAV8UZS6_9RHOD|nr:hypothetical protein NDN08_008225 [Rhodosorus marinus]